MTHIPGMIKILLQNGGGGAGHINSSWIDGGKLLSIQLKRQSHLFKWAVKSIFQDFPITLIERVNIRLFANL
jgi:hypothetical protein